VTEVVSKATSTHPLTRLAYNPVVGARRLTHVRDEAIDARTPETVEAPGLESLHC
jgi:hypothetical protein